MFHQITAVESVAEVKAVGTVDSGPAATTESTAKPPPFKDPSFMVSVGVHLGLSLSASVAYLQFLTPFFLS